jgi:hypothetical protein
VLDIIDVSHSPRGDLAVVSESGATVAWPSGGGAPGIGRGGLHVRSTQAPEQVAHAAGRADCVTFTRDGERVAWSGMSGTIGRTFCATMTETGGQGRRTSPSAMEVDAQLRPELLRCWGQRSRRGRLGG